MIIFNKENKTFHLATQNSSYIMKILENGMLTHWYYGARIDDARPLVYVADNGNAWLRLRTGNQSWRIACRRRRKLAK